MKVLLIGIDGVRPDILAEARASNLDALAARGGMKPITIDERGVTISGPMWSTILTGTWPAEHGISDNDAQPAERVPDVFTRLRRAGLAHAPIAAASWPPLTSRYGCGPIVNPVEVRAYTAPLVTEHTEDYLFGDDVVKNAAIGWLGMPETDGGFVYFGVVDEIGHARGIGQEYRDAIERVDAQVGEVLQALDARTDRDDWAVLVTTDHGHVDAGGHGGFTPEECNIWVLSNRAELLDRINSPDQIAPAIEQTYAAA